MSAENVEIIRRSYEIFETTGEVPFDLIDPDVEVRDYDLPDAAGEVFRGHEGCMQWVALYTLDAGKVTRCDYYGSAEEAFEAAGVPELRTQA
jgi:hypothetical protein